MISLSFHGAAGTVTGSKYLLKANDKSILIDCGLFQGSRELKERNWSKPAFNPTDVAAIIITHGHIDHIGYLPRLVSLGFNGKIFATPPTVDISAVSLLDTAKIQEEDAEYRNRKKLTRHAPALPLFTVDDVEQVGKLMSPVQFGSWTHIGKEFKFRYHVAGHLLGAAGVEIEVNDGNKTITLLCSGDVGRYGNLLTIDPSEPPQCNYLICESTYGGQMHPVEDPHTILADLINDVIRRSSILLIPAFAIGRTQQIVYLVNDLIIHGRIPPIDIHVDSPMAITATDIYTKYSSYHRLEAGLPCGLKGIIEGDHVKLHRTKKSSKSLNDLAGPAIIISSSGMMTGGRIMHHLLNRLGNPSTTIAVVGFMPEGTLGRKLLDGEKLVYIHKTPIDVQAKIVKISSLSGHADYQELLHWVEPMTTAPRTVFLTHGEPPMAAAMADHLSSVRGWNTLVPVMDQVVELN